MKKTIRVVMSLLLCIFGLGTTLTSAQPAAETILNNLCGEPATRSDEMKESALAVEKWLNSDSNSSDQSQLSWGEYMNQVMYPGNAYFHIQDFARNVQKATIPFLVEQATDTAKKLAHDVDYCEKHCKNFPPAFRTILNHWTNRVTALQTEKAEEIKTYKEEVAYKAKKDAQLLHLLEEVMKRQDEMKEKQEAQTYTEDVIKENDIPDTWARMLRERVK